MVSSLAAVVAISLMSTAVLSATAYEPMLSDSMTYVRCSWYATRFLKILDSNRAVRPRFEFDEGPSFLKNPHISDEEKDRNGLDDCGLSWINSTQLYSGIDKVIFVGDSTIMRNYMYVKNATEEEYTQKVQKLDEDVLNTTIPLESGRELELHFIRLLHVRESTMLVDRAFEIATADSMIVFTFGPHDTGWLVFRRPMPGYRKSGVGNWKYAKNFWNRNIAVLTTHIAERLRKFELERGDPQRPEGWRRPFVVIREQFLPNCKHPKYSKYPLITKCADLLSPIVVPYYRASIRALLAPVSISSISIDALFPTCVLVDAGHLARWCKEFEMQLLIQSYRMARKSNTIQGFRIGDVRSLFHLLGNFSLEGGSEWVTRRPLKPLLTAKINETCMKKTVLAWDEGVDVESSNCTSPSGSNPQGMPPVPSSQPSGETVVVHTTGGSNAGSDETQRLSTAWYNQPFLTFFGGLVLIAAGVAGMLLSGDSST